MVRVKPSGHPVESMLYFGPIRVRVNIQEPIVVPGTRKLKLPFDVLKQGSWLLLHRRGKRFPILRGLGQGPYVLRSLKFNSHLVEPVQPP